MRTVALALLALLGLACGGETGPDPFEPTVTRVVVEVDVQEGAEPFTGETVYGDTWDLTVENVAALVGDDVELVVPRTLEDMGALDDVPEGDLDTSALQDIAAASLDDPGDDETASYHVLFLDRFFEEDGERRENVLGVSLGGTRIVAMFKPVIGEGLVLDQGIARFVEQSTMIHELGHAIGLVNNGLGMVNDHEDEEHPAHCNDEDCVMFFLNEGFNDAVGYARDALVRGDRVLFNDACLADAAAARQFSAEASAAQ